MDTVAGYMAQSNSSFPFIKVVDGQKEFDFTFFLFENTFIWFRVGKVVDSCLLLFASEALSEFTVQMKTLFLHFHKAKWKQFGLFSGNIYPCLVMFNFRFWDIFNFLFLFQYRLYATTPTGLGTGQALENTSLRILTQPFAPMLFMVLLFWVIMASLNPTTVGLIWIMSFTRKLLLWKGT